MIHGYEVIIIKNGESTLIAVIVTAVVTIILSVAISGRYEKSAYEEGYEAGYHEAYLEYDREEEYEKELEFEISSEREYILDKLHSRFKDFEKSRCFSVLNDFISGSTFSEDDLLYAVEYLLVEYEYVTTEFIG